MKILVTGSSSGIGHALTLALLEAGHSVWGLARSKQNHLDSNFTSSICDVADWNSIESAAQTIAKTWGKVDALILAAGIQGEIAPGVKADPQAWSTTVRKNLEGTYFPIRAFTALLNTQGNRPKVVCFSGGGATKARVNFSAYACAKTAIVRLVETLAEENPSFDINCIAPGAINTRLTDEVIQKGPSICGVKEYEEAVKQKASGGQSLEKAIALIKWLLSENSNGISGKLISAQWDTWEKFPDSKALLQTSDIFTLRRIVPEDRLKSR